MESQKRNELLQHSPIKQILMTPEIWTGITFTNYYVWMSQGHLIPAHAGFLVFSLISVYLYSKEIKKRVSLILKSSCLLPLAFLFGKIDAIHFYNAKFGIYSEYLNFSVSIWAFFILLSSIPALLMLVVGLGFFCRATKQKGWAGLKTGIHSVSAFILSFGFIVLGQQIEKWHMLPLLADTYLVSDCNPENKYGNGRYIRKDHKTCYRVGFKGFTPILLPFHAPKP